MKGNQRLWKVLEIKTGHGARKAEVETLNACEVHRQSVPIAPAFGDALRGVEYDLELLVAEADGLRIQVTSSASTSCA